MAALVYVTEDALKVALHGLKGRIATIIATSLKDSRKRGRSTSSALALSSDEPSEGEKSLSGDEDHVQSEHSEDGRFPATSQSLKMQVQYYAEMVRASR